MKYKFYIGIDISKLWFDAACISSMDPDSITLKRFENSMSGFAELLRWIRTIHNRKRECLICFEETGRYSYQLWSFLSEKRWDFLMEQAIQIKKTAGIRRGKNDKADAVMIAHYIFLRGHIVELTKPPIAKLTSLMTLLTYRERLLKTSNRFKVTGKDLKNNFEKKIYKNIPAESAAIAKDFRERASEVEVKIIHLITSDKKLNHLFNLIISVPGIGNIVGAYILYYTKAFSKHLEYRKFACYCGIAPFEYTSGKSITSSKKISVLGNKKMKALLNIAAINVTVRRPNYDNEFMLYYRKKIAEGKHHSSVLNIIKNKIISRVYAAVKRGTPYNKNYSRLISEE